MSEPIPPRLLGFYRRTSYRVGETDIRIGRRVPRCLFAQAGSRTAIILTAWNPRSRRCPDGWNHRMQRQLRQHLRRFPVIAAEGSLRQWREAMLLAGGPEAPLVRIAARFRQFAVVVLQRGQAARLRPVAYAPR